MKRPPVNSILKNNLNWSDLSSLFCISSIKTDDVLASAPDECTPGDTLLNPVC